MHSTGTVAAGIVQAAAWLMAVAAVCAVIFDRHPAIGIYSAALAVFAACAVHALLALLVDQWRAQRSTEDLLDDLLREVCEMRADQVE